MNRAAQRCFFIIPRCNNDRPLISKFIFRYIKHEQNGGCRQRMKSTAGKLFCGRIFIGTKGEIIMGISTVIIKNKPVIVVNCSNLGVGSEKEILQTLKEGHALVASKPEKSVNIITDVTNMKFNSEVSNAFKEFAAANTKYVKESVIVGVSGLQQIIFSTVKVLTKRDYHLVNMMEDARKYFEAL
ncbi:MAG: hypothetical protein AAGU74_12990 [Bacillota bacterium]